MSQENIKKLIDIINENIDCNQNDDSVTDNDVNLSDLDEKVKQLHDPSLTRTQFEELANDDDVLKHLGRTMYGDQDNEPVSVGGFRATDANYKRWGQKIVNYLRNNRGVA